MIDNTDPNPGQLDITTTNGLNDALNGFEGAVPIEKLTPAEAFENIAKQGTS